MGSFDADADVVRYFEANRALGFCTLLVKDDMARRGDPYLPRDIAFVDDRVLHWTEIGPGARSATQLVRNGSTGHPLNAFVSRRPPADMKSLLGRQIDSLLERICADICTVMVSVFDGESFVVMNADEPLLSARNRLNR